jgi:hypothetical protein
MNKGYILKAESTAMGTVYYMNVICMTEQKEYAEVFPNREEAENNMGHFKAMFHDKEPKFTIEETELTEEV